MKDILLKVKNLIENDNTVEARELLESVCSAEIRDAELHIEISKLCEELGMVKRMVDELNLAFRDAPQDLNILKQLAVVHYDSGNYEKSKRYWLKIINDRPNDVEAYKELGGVLEDMNNYEEAKSVYEQGFERTKNDSFRQLVESIKYHNIDKEIERKSTLDQTSAEQKEILPDETQLVRFLNLFAGREGVYARQWLSPTGECGYTPIKEPLTYKVAKNHIMGNYTVGVYQLRLDNTVNFVVFDIDIPKQMLSKLITNQQFPLYNGF